MVAGIISIVNDFKINERKRAIIAIICVAFILVFNFGGIHILNKILEPPKDAKEKAEKCEQSTECYKNDEIVFCLYKYEKIKCPIVIVEDKIKEAEGTS